MSIENVGFLKAKVWWAEQLGVLTAHCSRPRTVVRLATTARMNHMMRRRDISIAFVSLRIEFDFQGSGWRRQLHSEAAKKGIVEGVCLIRVGAGLHNRGEVSFEQ